MSRPGSAGDSSSTVEKTSTVASKKRDSNWWWRWDDEPESLPKSINNPVSIESTGKRTRFQRKRFPEPVPYSGETEEDARIRGLNDGSYPSRHESKKRKVQELAIEVGFFRQKKPPVVALVVSDNVCFKVPIAAPPCPRSPRRKTSNDAPSCSTHGTHSPIVPTMVQHEKKEASEGNWLLMRQIELLDDHRSRKTTNLEREIIRLRDKNFELCRNLDWYRSLYEERQHGSSRMDVVRKLNQELENRNIEIEERIQQNAIFKDQIDSAEVVRRIFKNLETGDDVVPRLSLGVAQLETEICQAAHLISQCRSAKQLANVSKQPKRYRGLSDMVSSTLKSMQLLSSCSEPAFCALLFSFVRDRVFYSDCWATLQLEGFMLGGYRTLIQQVAPEGTMEGFHRAAVDLMLKENHPFRDVWVRSHVENVQREALTFFSPLLNPSKLERLRGDVERTLKRVFTNAFQLRAQLVPPKGQRYELIQFRPGTLFNPEYMSPQTTINNHVSPVEAKGQKVKICVHGCLVSHEIEEEPSEGEALKTITQSFIYSGQEDGLACNSMKGVLKSEKSVVILDDNIQL
ncbi:hypothetical protein N7492_006457 [Penicillium capsulatum]|uniref:Uncharacterized protein n=1 Tax=Penicillium capsulatum TaxID=69766 RepID=A0A9W9I2W2_9EURO|nr:hypothetical protein N7492_006457 [Penicillium capsulatum]KAJ6116297.1 hypothetical protein N7512_006022 [Penicillium capsulatum]